MAHLFPEPGPKVLLVASDRELTELVVDTMRRAGMSGFVVRDEVAALRYALVDRPAAVVLDLPAEDHDRFRFMRVLRRRGRVLGLTSSEVEDDELAPHELVRKPVSPHQLVDALTRSLSEATHASGTSRWTTRELARVNVASATGGCHLVVWFRTRLGELLSVHQSIEAAITRFALDCVQDLASSGILVTHLEVVGDLYTARVSRGRRLVVELTVLGLGHGVEETTFARRVARLAQRRIAARGLTPRPRVRVIAARVAPLALGELRDAAAVRKATSSGTRSRSFRRIVSTAAVSMLTAVFLVFLWSQKPGEHQVPLSAALPTAAPTTIATGQPAAPKDVARVQNMQQARVELIAHVSPAPPMATAAPARAALEVGPTDRVFQFYQWLQQGDFDAITLILSPRMRAEVPWEPRLLRERLPPGQLSVLKAERLSTEQSANQATVAVDVLEQLPPPLSTPLEYIGTWDLIRGPTGWLLDHPDMQISSRATQT